MKGSLAEALSRTFLLCRDHEIIGENEPTDEQLIEAFRGTRVVVVADSNNLSSAAGQTALVALVDVVARLGVSISLAIPEVPTLGYQPPLRGMLLRSGILEFGSDILPDTYVEICEADAPADIAFVLGDAEYGGPAELALRLSGDAWSGRSTPASEAGSRWHGDFPVGGQVAAGIAAPEPFKAALRKLGRDLPFPVGDAYLVPVDRASVRLARETTSATSWDRGQVDCISGGAITNSVLFCLLRVPGLTADVRVLEPERLDVSNQNRYVLVRLADALAGRRKVDQLSDWSHLGVRLSGDDVRFDLNTRARVVPLAPIVLVGVDDIPSRWLVQREFPEWLGVGSTSHFLTITSSHRPGQPCAGCLHPYDDPDGRIIPTASFVSYWAGLLLAVRLLRHKAGAPLDGGEQQTYCVPLRLDQPYSYWQRPVSRHLFCPVGCSAVSDPAA